MKIAVIGAGSMGMAFVRSWLTKEIHPKEDIVIVESSAKRIEEVLSECQIQITSDYSTVKDAQIIFIAVKPQDFKAAAKDLVKVINKQQIIVSIMAGVTIQTVKDSLGLHAGVVRVMPNLPILTASGISAYYPDPSVEAVMINILDQLLKAGGEVLRLDSEELLNAVTATSGSGPGYVFYILDHLMQTSKELGFNEEQARHLISATIKGAVDLWLKDGRSAEELRKAVTSKGGTTEAALLHFDESNLGKILKDGILKANARAGELIKS
jgi:pyrroline-5-carboxylate reductase